MEHLGSKQFIFIRQYVIWRPAETQRMADLPKGRIHHLPPACIVINKFLLNNSWTLCICPKRTSYLWYMVMPNTYCKKYLDRYSDTTSWSAVLICHIDCLKSYNCYFDWSLLLNISFSDVLNSGSNIM
jgi:hypothetical protein